MDIKHQTRVWLHLKCNLRSSICSKTSLAWHMLRSMLDRCKRHQTRVWLLHKRLNSRSNHRRWISWRLTCMQVLCSNTLVSRTLVVTLVMQSMLLRSPKTSLVIQEVWLDWHQRSRSLALIASWFPNQSEAEEASWAMLNKPTSRYLIKIKTLLTK